MSYLSKLEEKDTKDLEYGCCNSFRNTNILDKIPVKIRSSAFDNICTSQLMHQTHRRTFDSRPAAELTVQSRESSDPLKNASMLIDDLNGRILKQNAKVKSYAQQLNQRQTFLDKTQHENQKRLQKGEPIFPTPDLDTVFGPLPVPSRIENIINLASLKRQSQAIKDSSVGALEYQKIISEAVESL